MVVEDEPSLAELYATYLDSESEFTVRTATSGREALERFGPGIDVLLLDRQMPDLSGDEVLSQLREAGHDVPVAMVTAVEPDTDIVEMGFDEYLSKPVDRDALVRTVRVLANRSSFERKSREFFRLAAKKASLTGNATAGDDDARAELLTRMTRIRRQLDETIRETAREDPIVVSRSDPTQAEIETLLTEVYEHELPPDVRDLVDDYQALRDARPPFMWKWVHRLAPNNTLPCVDDEYRDDVPIDKTIIILFVTLLDDLLEKNHDTATFNELAKLPSAETEPEPDADGVDAEYVRFATRVWETLVDRIERAPHFELYEELFRFDVKQATNSIEYSDLAIRRPDLSTMSDLERYESHNMVMFSYADVDLMHSPVAVRDDLPTLREAIWTAQLMGRIGNWVSTWEREIREGDFSSGPVVYALNNDIVSHTELEAAREEGGERADRLVERIKAAGVEKHFLTRWERHYHELCEYDRDLSTVDLGPFIDGTEEVLRYHLASTGLK